MHHLLKKKHTGILIPLFSMRSNKDWGIGDIATMSMWLDFVKNLNMDILQILPINEIQPTTNCPYTALSGFAIDPIYISVENVEDIKESKEILEEIKSKNFQNELKELKDSKKVLYDRVRFLKFGILWKIYQEFLKKHWARKSTKGKEFSMFIEKNSYWLNDYAVFRRLKDVYKWISWTKWEIPYKEKNSQALKDFEKSNEIQILFFKYLQYLISLQWDKMKEKAKKLGILLFGDLPFMVNQESSDVWSRQNEFDLTCSIGAPPDDYSAIGQKWGLPSYRWEEIEKNNFQWWRLRVKKASELYEIYRIDHMVGFFRTWLVPYNTNQKPDFDLKDEGFQRIRGRRFLEAIISASESLPVAEDLGLIPPYVRETLKELNIPGYKVMRWEKEKNEYLSPEKYYVISLATSSTHDNEPLAEWWRIISQKEKSLFWHMISGTKTPAPRFSTAHNEILKRLIQSNSIIVIIPIQDIFGIKDRINTPNTTGDINWTYRFDVPIENIYKHKKLLEKINQIKKLIQENRC